MGSYDSQPSPQTAAHKQECRREHGTGEITRRMSLTQGAKDKFAAFRFFRTQNRVKVAEELGTGSYAYLRL